MSLSLALIAFLQVVQPTTPTDAQTTPPTVNQSATTTPAVASATIATAARAIRRPVIDGKDDDEVWREAQPITAFRQFSPVANGDARFKTEAKVAYDDDNFYVFIRMFDPHPDSIMRPLTRRDVRGASDQIKLIIDSYHDKRTGFEFAVNPAGVKRDFAMYNDINEDAPGTASGSATTRRLARLDRRVPHSALAAPLRQAKAHTFGFGVWRDIERFKERDELAGVPASDERLHVAARHRRTDHRHSVAAPARDRAVRRSEERLRRSRSRRNDRNSRPSGGADLKFGLTLESHARRDGESGLRPGRSRSVGAQPLGVRDVLRRAAAVLRRRHGDSISFQLNCNIVQLQTTKGCSTRGASAARRSSAVSTATRRSPTSTTDPRRREAHGTRSRTDCRSACSTRSPSARTARSTRRSSRPRTTRCCARSRICAEARAASA